MIITLKNADFSQSNIGTLSTWRITRSLGSGATYDGVTSVDKGAAFSATVTIAEGYEIGSAGVTVTMGGVGQTYTIVGNVITISIAAVTGNVVIKVPTVNITTGGEEEPEVPVNNYTFTINPTPSNATVTLTAPGYTQSGKSITVPSGTSVSWTVAASGYTTQNGTKVVTKTESQNVVLAAASTGSGEAVEVGQYIDNAWIKYEDGSEVQLDKWVATNFIAVPSNVTGVKLPVTNGFSSSTAKTTPIAWYDSNKVHISSYDIGDNQPTWLKKNVTMAKPNNAAYVRFSFTDNPQGYIDVDTGGHQVITAIEPQWMV